MLNESANLIEKIGPFPYRLPRSPMLAHVDIFAGGMHLGAIQLRNLSSGGLGGTGYSLGARERLDLQLSGIGKVSAQLVWTSGAYFGLKFDHEINVGAFDLAGPESGAEPFRNVSFEGGQFHLKEHDFPSIDGGGCFVRTDGSAIDRYCD